MPTDIEFPEDFMRCVHFHGHICPGLSIGYRAAKAGLDHLRTKRSEDEELVAVVETDACGVDAVQVLTGCTFGKGNFVYKDHGKQAFTLIDRNSGQGIRLCMRPDGFAPKGRHQELMSKVMQGQATEDEEQEFAGLHQEASRQVVDMPLDELFEIQAGAFAVPDRARIDQSECCARCGEPVMRSKMVQADERLLCQACAG
ncbi:FmdE family protein [Desulfovermiculus halophilus]|jgi:formylmethanofuran dehydrogenase subunit E|uniref:FmdE family protein n=1 Tax=Desulfovermiculus halophilus TaxID=339722 RepID=UPI0004856032|nr:FmdE family protein [Desulfovermiculus halophilus]